jgi:hypothetical protein
MMRKYRLYLGGGGVRLAGLSRVGAVTTRGGAGRPAAARKTSAKKLTQVC